MKTQDFSYNQYNNLKEVVSAESLIKQNGNFVNAKNEIGSILSKKSKADLIGLWLIHKHNDISNSTRMVEHSEEYNDEIVLISEVKEFDEETVKVRPVNFRIAKHEGEINLIPLEFSELPTMPMLYDELLANEETISQIYNVLEKYNLQNIIGISLIGRFNDIDFSKNVFIEESSTEGAPMNISKLQNRSNDSDDIETNWKLNEGSGEIEPAFYCLTRCRRLSPGHSVYHWQCVQYI